MGFDQIINSGKAVLVDFYATWCGPCKAMGPVLEQLAAEAPANSSIIKVDVDKNPVAAAQYGIQGVPTFIIFKDGKPVWRHSGMIDKRSLLQLLQNHS